jgi:Flp pilus assembly protein CpaB
MNNKLFITMTLSIIAAASVCFLLWQMWENHQASEKIEANPPKGPVGFGAAAPALVR